VECVVLPLVPVMVIAKVPRVAVLETVRVKFDVPEPGAAIEVGLKLPVTPEGRPVAVKAIAALNPPETEVVTTAKPLWPRRNDPEVGETEMAKAPLPGAVTVSETVVVFVIPPPVPVTVMA